MFETRANSLDNCWCGFNDSIEINLTKCRSESKEKWSVGIIGIIQQTQHKESSSIDLDLCNQLYL